MLFSSAYLGESTKMRHIFTLISAFAIFTSFADARDLTWMYRQQASSEFFEYKDMLDTYRRSSVSSIISDSNTASLCPKTMGYTKVNPPSFKGENQHVSYRCKSFLFTILSLRKLTYLI